MIDVFPFAGYPIAVFGLGQSGLAAAKALVKSDAEVWAWDDDEDVRSHAAEEDIPLVNLYNCNWRELTSLVLSPGVPLHHPKKHRIVELAGDAGCEIIGDIELLGRTQRWCNYIGITGTNGKSTTTALIGHIMQTAGREAEVGGNIGVPALLLEALGPEGTYILEMSSYQLELTVSITFDVAILLNLSPDHLERYGGMSDYINAKRLIFHRHTKPRTAVIGVDDGLCHAIANELEIDGEQNVIRISGREIIAGGVYVENGILIDDTENSKTPVSSLLENPCLIGEHNGQNAAAAYAAAKTVGVAPHAIMACIQSYPGLVHRQEPVSLVDDVAFVNDSKATNADAAARAVASYDTVYWIAGGRSKEDGLEAVKNHFGNIRHAYLIGDAAMKFAQQLDGCIPFTLAEDLKTAVNQAFEAAKADISNQPVVLLSPACSSLDQFKNFEERGNMFKDLVEALPGKHLDPFERPGQFPGRVGPLGPEDMK